MYSSVTIDLRRFIHYLWCAPFKRYVTCAEDSLLQVVKAVLKVIQVMSFRVGFALFKRGRWRRIQKLVPLPEDVPESLPNHSLCSLMSVSIHRTEECDGRIEHSYQDTTYQAVQLVCPTYTIKLSSRVGCWQSIPNIHGMRLALIELNEAVAH